MDLQQKIGYIRKVTLYLFGILHCIMQTTAQAYEVDLHEAIEIGLSNNQSRFISQEQLAIAEAQYQQALSTYWPTVNLNGSFDRQDEDATFTIEELSVVADTPLGPLNANIPETELTLFDRDTAILSLDLSYPIYAGGKLSAVRKQAKIGVAIANEEVRRNDNQIIYDIKKYYYAALLAASLHEIAQSTFNSLSVTRDITKAFVERGSASVNQRDYLQSEMAVATVENQSNNFSANYKSAIAALKLVMGLDQSEKLLLKNGRLPEPSISPELDSLITQAKAGNSDIRTLALSIEYADEKILEARSGYLPKFLFSASSRHFENSFDEGLVNSQNRNNWTIGIKVQIPVFDGFATRSKISEAAHRRKKLQGQKVYIEQATATQIHNLLIELGRSQSTNKVGRRAVKFAKEHSKLTNSAYRNNVLKTDEVIKAKIYESILESQQVVSLHDISFNISSLELIIGRELTSKEKHANNIISSRINN